MLRYTIIYYSVFWPAAFAVNALAVNVLLLLLTFVRCSIQCFMQYQYSATGSIKLPVLA